MLGTILNKKGFTLIELTTAIVIVSILSVMARMGLVQIANGYLFARKNAVAAEQAQIALARVVKELSAVQTISLPATATSLTYTRAGASHTLAWKAALPAISALLPPASPVSSVTRSRRSSPREQYHTDNVRKFTLFSHYGLTIP